MFFKTSLKLAAVAAAVVGYCALSEPAAAQYGGRWVDCAGEDGFCRVPYPTVVRYGAIGRFVEQRTDRGIPCSNDVFGDPARGVRKRCAFLAQDGGPGRGGEWGGRPPRAGEWDGPPVRQPRWVSCAPERGYCEVPYPTRVRYGAGGRYYERRVGPEGTECSNRAFGDPIVGVSKSCAFLSR